MSKHFRVRCKYHPNEWVQRGEEVCCYCLDARDAQRRKEEQEEEDRLNEEFRDRYLKAFGKLPS